MTIRQFHQAWPGKTCRRNGKRLPIYPGFQIQLQCAAGRTEAALCTRREHGLFASMPLSRGRVTAGADLHRTHSGTPTLAAIAGVGATTEATKGTMAADTPARASLRATSRREVCSVSFATSGRCL